MSAHLEDCNGNGFGVCPYCEGAGWVRFQMSDDPYDIDEHECAECETAGVAKCPACNGDES